jgi:glyoxylase-like metal-dependent hydrolase (beta-lactamase superfamily II)/pimeloyl-ACP methyl ester carboxylesterase
LNAFIEELELKDVTLVIHDWGSGLGFNYAANNEENIKGIAFMEALLMPMPSYDAMPSPEMVEMFTNFRTPGVGEEMIMNQNFFVEQLLPSMILRELSDEEFNHYSEPYPTPESRKPVWKWPNEIPIGGEPKNTHDIISSYNQWMQTTEIPMLMIYATPGILGNEMAVQWAEDNLMNLETVHIGPGLHFIQEDNPDAIGEAISDWYQRMPNEMMDGAMDTMSGGIFDGVLMYASEPPVIDEEKGYAVTEIASGVFWLVGSGYQTIFLTTGEGVVVVDAPQPIGEKYLEAINEVTQEPITHMIYSHPHQDHTGAAGKIFPKDITYIAHQDTADALETDNDPNRPIPNMTLEGDFNTMEIGDKTIEFYNIGDFHSKGNLLIILPQYKVAMLVDLLRPSESPYRAFGVTPDIDLYLEIHDTLQDFDFDVLISGHTGLLATKEHIQQNKQFTLDVMANAQGAIDESVADPTQYCVDTTTEQWEDELENLDTFMIDHCNAMLEYHSSQ